MKKYTLLMYIAFMLCGSFAQENIMSDPSNVVLSGVGNVANGKYNTFDGSHNHAQGSINNFNGDQN
jgi:hypothetical protein